MDIKNFVLSYYKNSAETFHIQKKENSVEAQKPHTHKYFQVFFISKGSLEHCLKEQKAVLKRGDMFIVPPSTVHYITPEKNTVFYSFSFMEEFLDEQPTTNKFVKSFIRSLKSKEKQALKAKVTIQSEEILYVENIMAQILKEFDKKPLAYYENIQAYANILLIMLAREYFKKVSANISDHFENHKQFVLHGVEYIENNFTEKISLDEISKKSAMSKSNFCSLFLKLTGHTFNDYLNICRIKMASEYIKKGYKITSIYGLCGYNDFSTFYRNFRKIMGMSPQEYKKTVQ